MKKLKYFYQKFVPIKQNFCYKSSNVFCQIMPCGTATSRDLNSVSKVEWGSGRSPPRTNSFAYFHKHYSEFLCRNFGNLSGGVMGPVPPFWLCHCAGTKIILRPKHFFPFYSTRKYGITYNCMTFLAIVCFFHTK